jgi:hypothetical protein
MTVDLMVLQSCCQFASDVPPCGLGGVPRIDDRRRATAVNVLGR